MAKVPLPAFGTHSVLVMGMKWSVIGQVLSRFLG